jgi:2-oxoglutarate ferredoxin oxidoreductase subunit alpha
MMTRSVGPQIRGGEAAAMVRLAPDAVECHAAHFDLLLAMDWENAGRFGNEIALAPDALIISDPAVGEAPVDLVGQAPWRVDIRMQELCRAHPGWRSNLIVLGAAAELLGIPVDALQWVVTERFGAKGPEVLAVNVAALDAGRAAVLGHVGQHRLPPPRARRSRHWLITGNEAVGLGVIRGGVRFAAAYPITPATEILEWLAAALTQVGGTLVQAEDELASVSMIIGASYGGTPSVTATSGPGLSLMIEAIGLATAAEIPIVVIDVMRCGPSTGIPTKSEQSDLNIAVYGPHGDAPHLVLAPQSVPDCLLTGHWATHLAESLQVPAIVLSDEFVGQAQAAIDRPADLSPGGGRLRATNISAPYRRYAVGGSGISPMAIPGEPCGQYTAEGLTHNECGLPTSGAADHATQLDKRRDKLEQYAYGEMWATLEGEGETAILTWGSLTGVAREAVAAARAAGLAVRLIAPRLLLPVRPTDMRRALADVRRVLVVEQSHGAQFNKYLHAHYALPPDTSVLHRPGPLRIRSGEILDALLQGAAHE